MQSIVRPPNGSSQRWLASRRNQSLWRGSEKKALQLAGSSANFFALFCATFAGQGLNFSLTTFCSSFPAQLRQYLGLVLPLGLMA
jgi:hypothetical protein